MSEIAVVSTPQHCATEMTIADPRMILRTTGQETTMNVSPTVTKRTFDIPGGRLFTVLADPETYPAWLVGAKRIRDISPDWPAPGSHFKHTVGFGPIAVPDKTSVRAVQEPEMLELMVRARPVIEAVVHFHVIAMGPSSCQLTMTETPAGAYKLIAPVSQPLIKARNERSLDRLAALIRDLRPNTTP
jgi:uncharacterized protein YndB with AHSA1/START domain